MKLIIFIGIELLAALVMLLYRDCVIDIPYWPLRLAWLAFGAAMGALAGMYKAQIDQWLETNDQLNDERNMMEVYKFRVDEKDQIIRIKDATIDNLKKYADEDKEKHLNELDKSNKLFERVILDNMTLRGIMNDHKMMTFISAYQNNGAIMSQNALADKLGWTRAKVRRTADAINKLVGYEYIKWGEAKIKIKAVKSVKEVAEQKKTYELGFDEFEGLKIPKNWMDNFEVVNGLVLAGSTSCGATDPSVIMGCVNIKSCVQCICDDSNNSSARRLIAKVENEMKDKVHER